PLDLVLHPRVVRTQNRAHVFRISTVGAVREPDEVDEEHRYDLPLLGGLRLLHERCAARETEARAFGVLLAAGRTDERHGFQVWRASGDDTSRTAFTKPSSFGCESAPASSSTANAVVPGRVWFSQDTTLPGNRCRRTSGRSTRLAKRLSRFRSPPDSSTSPYGW